MLDRTLEKNWFNVPAKLDWWIGRSRWLKASLIILLIGIGGCSPIYVVKAGLAELKILRARQDIVEVLGDPNIDSATRGKLSFVLEARRFATSELGINVGDAYKTFAQLDQDTLALVVSASHKDRLEPKTWWFPIIGRVPYKGFFSLDDAQDEEDKLKQALNTLGIKSLNRLLEEIGLGKRVGNVVARQMTSFLNKKGEKKSSDTLSLEITGTEGLVVNYATCCKPIPGDSVIGHFTTNGLVVHQERCKNILSIREDPSQCFPVIGMKNYRENFLRI